MPHSSKFLKNCLFSIALIACLNAAPGDREGHVMKDVVPVELIPPAPILNPDEALNSFQVATGFELEQIAAEPLVQDPVGLIWDARGDAWVIEMSSYMIDILGSDEEAPISKIVRLKDSNGDGKLDQRTVMIDNLVLPRSIAFYKNGIIFATHTTLFYAKLDGDSVGPHELIDAEYSTIGNVEHRDNGMMLNLDNWYYNAKSNKRYRFLPLLHATPKGSKEIFRNQEFKVVREDMGTHRGQWGIARDDYGRLYYNTNSSPVIADRYYGNAIFASKKYNFIKVYPNDNLANTEVFPIRINPGVNRGYMKGTLKSDFRLDKMTATCAPVVYRGNQYPQQYSNLVLAAEPAANMLKATVMKRNGEVAEGRFLYENKEILASTDERFRPVALSNTPDGCISIVDLYRGILQHRGFVTSYLEKQIKMRDLDKGLHLGRIYKLKHQGDHQNDSIDITSLTPDQWTKLLEHPNAWHREQAQRLLVDHLVISQINHLKTCALNENNPVAQVAALWTLEGLGNIDEALLKTTLQSRHSEVVIASLAIMRSAHDQDLNFQNGLELLKMVDSKREELLVPLARTVATFNQVEAYPLLLNLLLSKPKHKMLLPVTLSAFADQDGAFIEYLGKNKEAATVLKSIQPFIRQEIKKGPALNAQDQKLFNRGKELYYGIAACMGCHGLEGEGLPLMGPPLDNSDWVTGNPNRLIAIMLHGLSGPIRVKGKKYETPMVMPGLKDHPQLKDEDLAAIATFIRNTWSNRAKPIDPKGFVSYREKSNDRALPFTEQELLKIK